jgi:predicted alpha/beta-fold hydrolase
MILSTIRALRLSIEKCVTIMDFENLLISPSFGFDDACWDYNDKCKMIDSLDKIRFPHFTVQALDVILFLKE